MSLVPRKEEQALLLLSENGRMYGLEMVKASGGELGRGTIYVVLDRLEEKGFVKSELADPPKGSRGPARRKYELTAEGSRVLDAMRETAKINARFGFGGA